MALREEQSVPCLPIFPSQGKLVPTGALVLRQTRRLHPVWAYPVRFRLSEPGLAAEAGFGKEAPGKKP